MTPEKKQKLIETLKAVQADVEKDAADFDGKPFTGKTMGEYMGYHGAAINAIARVCMDILEDSE